MKINQVQSDYGSADSFTKILIEAADESFPVKRVSKGKIPSPPWWDNECSEAIKSRKEAEMNYLAYTSSENFDLLSKSITETRKLFKKKKFDSWRKFCSEISPDIQPSAVWQKIHRFRSLYKESKSTVLPYTIANEFLSKLSPPSVQFHNIPLPISDYSELNSLFSFNELQGVLSVVRDSAPGPDGIPYSFLSNLTDNAKTYFLDIINHIMVSGSVPMFWKEQIIIPILKSNKPSDNALSYRPIALSSVLLKIIEHLVKNRLEFFVESNCLLAESQYGFRRGKSALDGISIFTTDIRLAFSENKSILSAFLDIQSAYDNVVISVLKHKLLTIKTPPLLINIIINLLLDRSLSLTVDDNSVVSRVLTKGLPQGSVLSPILYNIYTHDLESSFNGSISVLQYADDLLLYNASQSVQEASVAITSNLCLLKKWLDSNGLDLSASKSSVVLFSRMRRPAEPNVFYENLKIPVKKEVKFLGVVLDSKLTGIPHCNYVVSKCERSLNILRCLSGVWWGAHPFCLKLLYNALIRSVLDYGTFILEPGNISAFKKLDLMQSKSLRIVCGAMKSSPINALQVECNDPPLYLRRQYLSDRYLFRSFQFSNHPLRSKLNYLCEHINTSPYWKHKQPPRLVVSYRKFLSLESPTHCSNYLPLFCFSYDSLILNPNVNLNFLSSNRHQSNSEFKSLVNENWQGYHSIFTDASKIKNSCVGIGVYHPQYKIVQKVKFPKETSVFTGECVGLLKAVEYILLAKLNQTIVFSDSKSALQALMRFPFKSRNSNPVILEIRNIIFQCMNLNLKISFAWIPSHCGIKGNEIADTLAKEAISCGDVFPFKNYTCDLVNLSQDFLHSSWQSSWTESSQSKGKSYSTIQPTIPSKPWFFKIHFAKRVTTCLIRMRLGHVSTPAHLFKFKIVDNPACDCGAEFPSFYFALWQMRKPREPKSNRRRRRNKNFFFPIYSLVSHLCQDG
ncbi:uncharacterized protein LOC134199209 [Bombyx mori]|uniref:uncharacterized protein LOC134199209 n=1 Tax=Bombyx mori TaxID=7091 RepID=UPI002ED4A439